MWQWRDKQTGAPRVITRRATPTNPTNKDKKRFAWENIISKMGN